MLRERAASRDDNMAFAPIFHQPFSATFDRRAAVAGVNWSTWFDYLWLFRRAASQAVAKVDLVASVALATIGGVTEPSWSADRGMIIAPTAAYNTTLVPAASWSAYALISGAYDEGAIIGSYADSTHRFTLRWGTATWYARLGSGFESISSVATAGSYAMAGGATLKAYQNGSPVRSITGWPSANPTQPAVYIGERNGSTDPFGGDIWAVGFSATAWSAAQVAALDAAVKAATA